MIIPCVGADVRGDLNPDLTGASPPGILVSPGNQLIPRTACERLAARRSNLARCTVAVAWFQGQGKVDTRRHSRTASGGSGSISFPPRSLLSPVTASLYASLALSLSLSPHARVRAAVGDCLPSFADLAVNLLLISAIR